MKLKFNLDPSPKKALAVGVLIFVATFVSGIQTTTAMGEIPSKVQILSSLLSAVSATVTYWLGFLGYEKKEGE